jgi:hypothetical protein
LFDGLRATSNAAARSAATTAARCNETSPVPSTACSPSVGFHRATRSPWAKMAMASSVPRTTVVVRPARTGDGGAPASSMDGTVTNGERGCGCSPVADGERIKSCVRESRPELRPLPRLSGCCVPVASSVPMISSVRSKSPPTRITRRGRDITEKRSSLS